MTNSGQLIGPCDRRECMAFPAPIVTGSPTEMGMLKVLFSTWFPHVAHCAPLPNSDRQRLGPHTKVAPTAAARD